MSEKAAKAIEWIGAGIIVAGAAFFAFVYFRHVPITRAHHAILLWVLGFGILCYVPLSMRRLNEKSREADEAERSSSPDAGDLRKAATSLKRSLGLKIICAVVLIAYGFLKMRGIR